MKKFFEASDFYLGAPGQPGERYPSSEKDMEILSEITNAKLEREGKVVYGSERGGFITTPYTTGDRKFPDTHRALLINIEPIEVCKHEASKVVLVFDAYNCYQGHECECGARVQPKEFEEVKG